MKNLILVRHSSAEDPSYKVDDFDRQLTQEGITRAEAQAEKLSALIYGQARIVTSSAVRAIQTANIMADIAKIGRENIEVNPELYNAGEDILEKTCVMFDDNLPKHIIVAHNPGLHYFANYYLKSPLDRFSPGSICLLKFKISQWSEIQPYADECIFKPPY